jgi:hypothetical protein
VTPDFVTLILMALGAAIWAVQPRYCPECAHCRHARLQVQQAKEKLAADAASKAHTHFHMWYNVKMGDKSCATCRGKPDGSP